MVMIQTMGEKDCCSSIGDVEKHEQFKKLKKEDRIAKLQEVYDTYGVLSNEFFVQVKPFIMWAVYKSLRGMSYTYLEDLVNNAYEELVIAFQGGWTSHYNRQVYKEKTYQTPKYYAKCKNIGQFVIYTVGASVAKYRSKNFRNRIIHEDMEHDISEKLNFTDFEMKNNLDYTMKEPEYEQTFKYFKFNDNLARHIHVIEETQPHNNVLYNYILWKKHE